MELAASDRGWLALLREHARLHTPAALGLGLALLGVIALLIQSMTQLASGNAAPGFRLAMLGGLAGIATTALGAVPALWLRGLPQRVEDSLLGFAAGMMLAASAFSLLLPGLALAYPTGLGLAAGAMLFVVSHAVIPETHRNGHQTFATIGLMIGFALMMVLDTILG